MTRRHRKLHGVWSGEGFAEINFDTFVYQKLSEMDEFNTPPNPPSGATEQEIHIVPEGEIHELVFTMSNQHNSLVPVIRLYIDDNVVGGGEIDVFVAAPTESTDSGTTKFLVIGQSGGTAVWASADIANTSLVLFGYVRNFILS